MQYGYSLSDDYGTNKVVVRDFKSVPPGRVLCIIARDNDTEAEQIAVRIADLLNNSESKTNE